MEQLLDYFTPQTYTLKFCINKYTEEVHGSVEIVGKQLAPVVKLHAESMTIDRVALLTSTGIEYPEFTHQDGIITLPPLKPHRNPLTITIDFHYRLSRKMRGAYLSTYQYAGREERIVVTQFEPHYARNAFPCIDEPAGKAVFHLTISTTDVNDIILANTLEESKVVENDPSNKTVQMQTVVFSPTPRMSTYLLAFCIGKFHHYTSTSTHGVQVTSYCALNQPTSSLKYANEVATRALGYYDDLFGVKYPIPKLDQVALPDFEAGAMENWGLVTYREQCLLVDKLTSNDQKEYIATVITHELSHQWFGNLVTMRWWDDLWLNESFATMMEYYCTDALYPEYHIWQDFFTGDCLAALSRDCLPGVQAVKQEVEDPAEISALFDGAIVYAKGAHLVFMLMRLMTPRRFFAGMKEYFRKHQYHNTVADDLWDALQAHAQFDVKEFMHAWISQPGYPVITDDVQQRFLITGATDGTKWPLPKIQDDMSGHYLINLSGPEFQVALDKFDRLSLEQQLRLLVDRRLLALTSLVSSASLCDVVQQLAGENSQPVWNVLSDILGNLRFFCPSIDSSAKSSDKKPNNVSILYKNFVQKSIATQYARLSVKQKPRETNDDTKLRQIILRWAVFSEYQPYLEEITSLYQSEYENIHPDARLAILQAYYRLHEEDKADLFDQFLQDYRQTASPDLKAGLRAVICSSRQPRHLKRCLELLKQPKVVRPQDHLYLFAGLLRNDYARTVALDWLYQNWDYVCEMTENKSTEDYPRIAAGVLRTTAESERFFTFFDRFSDNPAMARIINMARPQVSAHLRLLQLDSDAVWQRLQELVGD